MPTKTTSRKTDIKDFNFLYDYILVKAISVEGTSGLVKPEQYDDKPEFGEVVKVGEGRLLEDGTVVPSKVKPGDVIFFGKYSSMSVRTLGEDYFVIREDDVMGVNA